ncbi:lumazine-binding domain protein [Nocardiopsis metallicus]|uniref:Nuclear transport factor 2 family protein n=1 Tax=Nocardiopsis metallicus TaxID=179819 RepID=A0A840WJH4_9ACTN|nr:lumazine-binding domain protein [Nocardiopsis metallicus]MBB5492025.1 hypothetical protein [Nocardiopsis metallicus]
MRRTLLCAALPLFLALAACGGDDETPDENSVEEVDGEAAAGPDEDEAAAAAQAVAEGFLASFAAGDGEAGCAFVDESAQAAIIAQGGGAEDCAEAFPEYVANVPGADAIEIGEVTVSTDLDGDALIANVELVHAEESPGALEVRQGNDGEWRATRLPGTTLGGA